MTMFLSPLGSAPLITDRNWKQFVQQTRQSEYGSGYVERDWSAQPAGSLSFAAPFPIPVIPRHEWADRIEELTRTKRLLSDLLQRRNIAVKHQQRTKYCWINCTLDAAAILRVVQGEPYVELSAASVGGPMLKYQDRGYSVTTGMQWFAEHGAAPVELWPNAAIDRRYATPQVAAERQKYRLLEWWELQPRNFDQKMTCLLLRLPVPCGYSWWGHAIDAVDPVRLGRDEFGTRERNSWGSDWGDNGYCILEEGRSRASEQFCPGAMSLANT